jgi:hypothetical protein
MTEVVPPPWEAANDTERSLVGAVARGDRREYFQLVAVSELFMPVLAQDRDRSGPQRFVTAEILGARYLPVFTSIPTLARVMTGYADAYTVTSYAELRRKWPEPEWRLAVNPGTPIDAYVSVDAVEQAALGQVEVPTAAEILTEAQQALGGGEADPPGLVTQADALAGARRRADVDGYVRALLESDVVVPVAAPADPDAIVHPGFPWLVVDPDGAASIEVFTSVTTLAQAGRDPVAMVTVPFTGVVLGWPDERYALVVDPDTPLETTVPGTYVSALVMWLPDDGPPETVGPHG